MTIEPKDEFLHTLPAKGDLEIQDDLGEQAFYYIKPEDAKAVTNPPEPWNRITQAFPSTTDDADCAWQCIALGQPTAAVFHALRVVEKGLQQLNIALKTKISKVADSQGWARLIESLESAARKLGGKHPTKTIAKKRQKLLDALGSVSVIKDAWRDYVMHATVAYDADAARIILIAGG